MLTAEPKKWDQKYLMRSKPFVTTCINKRMHKDISAQKEKQNKIKLKKKVLSVRFQSVL